MKPEIFNEVEAQLINAFADGILDGVCTADMRQLEDMGIAPDDDTTQVYYFDWEEGVCEETVQMLTLYSTPYQGQQLVDDVKDIIPVILQPLMYEAIAEQNASAVNQLAEAIVYVIGMSIKQEREDG